MTHDLGIALSGGGHRATAFCLGSLLYLADSGQNEHVKTIASVSGGSLLNAYIALLEKPFDKQTKSDFRTHSAAFARQIAGNPLLWWTALSLALVSCAIWLLPLASWTRVLACLPPAAMSILIGPKSRGTFWGWSGTWLWVNFMTFIAGILTSVLLSPMPYLYFSQLWDFPLPRMPVALLAATVLLIGFGLRQIVASMAFSYTLRGPSMTAGIKLNACPPGNVKHIYCATVLTPGRHFYFSRDFVFSPGYGVGSSAAVRLCDAVQASSNLPVAFPYRSFRTADFQFREEFRSELPHSVVLTDGGVYDNTATAWFLELNETRFDMERQARYYRWTELARRQLTETHREIADLRKKIARCDNELAKRGSDREAEDHSYLREQKTIDEATIKVLERNSELSSELLNEFLRKCSAVPFATLQNLVMPTVAPDGLLAINAAYPRPWEESKVWARFTRVVDAFGLLSVVNVFYNSANLQRFKELRQGFLTGKLRGAFVSIDEAPATLATYVANPKEFLSIYDAKRDRLLIDLAEKGVSLDFVGSALRRDAAVMLRSRYVPDGQIARDLVERAEEALEHMAPGVRGHFTKVRTISEMVDQTWAETMSANKQLEEAGKKPSSNETGVAEHGNRQQALDALLEKIKSLELRKSFANAVWRTENEGQRQALESSFRNAISAERLARQLKPRQPVERAWDNDDSVGDTRVLYEGYLVLRREERLALDNIMTATTFKPLGTRATAQLMRHGYLSAMMNLYVLCGDYPLVDAPSFDQFQELASGKAL